MNKIKEYVPAFVDIVRDTLQTVEFETLEELLAIPFVKKPMANNRFYRYSQDVYDTGMGPKHIALVAEYDDGCFWLVRGYLDEPVEGLPKFVPKYKKESK